MTAAIKTKNVVEIFPPPPQALSQAVLDALPAHVAVLNQDGIIVAVNRAWTQFAFENSELTHRIPSVGVNYLDVARRSVGAYTDGARAAHDGIAAVLKGAADQFSIEYPCHSPTRKRWFQMQVTPVRDMAEPVAVVMHHDITERKHAEETLRESEERFRNMADHSSLIVWVTDADGRCTYVNRRWQASTGQAAEEALGFGWLDALHPEDRACVDETFRAANVLQEPYRQEYRLRRADGAYGWVIDSAAPRYSSTGEYLGYVGSIFDIDARRTAEEAAVATEGQLRSFTAQLQNRLRQQAAVAELGMFAFKTSDLDELLNKSVAMVSQTLGNEYASVLELQPDGQCLLLRAGSGWKEGLVGQVRMPADPKSRAGYSLITREPVIVANLAEDTRFARAELLANHGVVSSMSVVVEGHEKPFGVFGTHSRERRDYTKDDVFFLQSVANILGDFIDRQRMETRYQLLVHSVEDYAIVMLDAGGTVTTWNSGAERMTGYTADEILGRSTACLYTKEDADDGKPEWELAESAEKGRLSHEGWRLRKDGTRFLAHSLTFALKDPAGKLLGFSRVVRDVTSQRREEESLRSAVDHSVDAIVTIDQHGIIQSSAGAARKIFGYTSDELVGRNISMLMPEPMRSEHNSYLANYLRTGVGKIIGQARELSGIRKDGSEVPLELVITEFQLNGGRFFTGIVRDVTKRKILEEQLRQSQKMEAIGQLAGGVAHDFNNLLTIINGYSEVLMGSLSGADPHRALVAEVAKAGNRAAALTSQLLAFSRKQILTPKLLSLNEVAQNSERMLRRVIGEDVLLVSEYDPELHQVKVDPGQIEQVILNLAVNARDAMPQGGSLTLATFNLTLDGRQSPDYPGCKPGNYAVLAVADTGCGMPPEVKERIFEPFFTTKGVGKGTGLGLATVYGIVKQSEGYVLVDSATRLGTTFRILLPAVLEPASSSSPGHSENPLRGGTETIFLVEDEEGVRQLARRVLEMHGYTVVEACTGNEALEREQAHTGAIHALITDVVMPGLSGRDVAEAFRRRRPGLKVLYMSGYTDDAILRHGLVDAADAFLQKPFLPLLLAQKVREILDDNK